MATRGAGTTLVRRGITTMMMMPIGLSIVHRARGTGVEGGPEGDTNFGTAIMLGIAYASSIGGVGTLIGTAPNALFAGAACGSGQSVDPDERPTSASTTTTR